ncbi:hypothetical protein [Streptomyces sp. NRRL S-646]|uniref:hypothetical protein n=1 Tax=Streptomyces sp. NRRL S-646 TaxID=1463917 RepID=UPI001F3E4FD4|nr:hypothetical protein [Streptomyces sp. NRRL S-646]
MRAAGAALITVLALSGGALTTAAPASASEQCDPHVTRSYSQTSSSWWLIAAGGTVENPKAKEVREEVTFDTSGTRSTSVAAEVGAKVDTVVAEINAKTSFSVTKTITFTKGRKTTIVVGPHSTVHYKIGVKQRKFLVTSKRTYSNCKVTTSYGTVTAADPTTETS